MSWAGHDPNSENDAASTATTISDANLAATASGPAGVVAGASITYTLGLSNAGPDPGIGAALSDTLPEHTRFVSLAADRRARRSSSPRPRPVPPAP